MGGVAGDQSAASARDLDLDDDGDTTEKIRNSVAVISRQDFLGTQRQRCHSAAGVPCISTRREAAKRASLPAGAWLLSWTEGIRQEPRGSFKIISVTIKKQLTNGPTRGRYRGRFPCKTTK